MLFVIAPTELSRSAVVQDHGLCRVESAASEEVANFESVDHTIATIPEVEQVEYLTYVWKKTKKQRRRSTHAIDINTKLESTRGMHITHSMLYTGVVLRSYIIWEWRIDLYLDTVLIGQLNDSWQII